MIPSKLIFLSLVVVILGGCQSKEKVYQGVYEGLKNREEIVRPPNEPGPSKMPSYDTYKREREIILKDRKE
jgi:hypothetical protein